MLERKDYSKPMVKPLMLTVFPSDFLTCDGERINNDTFRVELMNPKTGNP